MPHTRVRCALFQVDSQSDCRTFRFQLKAALMQKSIPCGTPSCCGAQEGSGGSLALLQPQWYCLGLPWVRLMEVTLGIQVTWMQPPKARWCGVDRRARSSLLLLVTRQLSSAFLSLPRGPGLADVRKKPAQAKGWQGVKSQLRPVFCLCRATSSFHSMKLHF